VGKTWLVIVIPLILVIGVVYFLMINGYIPNPLSKKSISSNLGEQIYEQVQNPLEEKLPETNPFSAETNPAKKAYPNPFK